jgi:hypothetical protein
MPRPAQTGPLRHFYVTAGDDGLMNMPYSRSIDLTDIHSLTFNLPMKTSFIE